MLKRFLNLKIATKLIIGFILVAIISGVVGAVGLINILNINKADTQLYELNTVGIKTVAEADVYFQRIRVNALKMMVDDTNMDTYTGNLETFSAEVNNLLEAYQDCILSEENRNLYADLLKNNETFSAVIDEIVKAIGNGNVQEAEAMILGEAQTAGDLLQASFDSIFEFNVKAAEERAGSNDSAAQNATIIMIAIIVAGIVLAILLGVGISRIISRPLNLMTEAADRLALGDVNTDVEVKGKDETGRLAESFRRMIANIRNQAITVEQIAEGDLTAEVTINSDNDLLGKKLYEMAEKNNQVLNNIASASEQVAAGAKQVSDASISLSQGATEQASSVEELTASLEQISAQTKINAENANQANKLAEIAKDNAVNGNSRMKEMQNAMQEINTSSSNISKIIKVIDEIAFQTNILALNAAVEAARAGQHGKGFAVVAEEVRNLAARSAKAAKETTDMIEGSIRTVEVGTKYADETAQALNRIVEGITKAADLVNSIAIASNEQAIGVEQINQGIMQVSQVVQTNSATSQESAAASEELSSQADLLKAEISKFKLKKVYARYNRYDELDPDVLNALENREERNFTRQQEDYRQKEKAAGKAKIVLSDKEFGKY
jgi:methyl-accepting chemotaxis protein